MFLQLIFLPFSTHLPYWLNHTHYPLGKVNWKSNWDKWGAQLFLFSQKCNGYLKQHVIIFKDFTMNMCLKMKITNVCIAIILLDFLISIIDGVRLLVSSGIYLQLPQCKAPTLSLCLSFCVCVYEFNTYFCTHAMSRPLLHGFDVIERHMWPMSLFSSS